MAYEGVAVSTVQKDSENSQNLNVTASSDLNESATSLDLSSKS